MNVIFIVLDSVRFYKFGCCGSMEGLTPFIDRLSKRGVLFDNAISQGNCTDPSLWSIFTSKFPSEHGVLANAWNPRENFKTMTDFLKQGRNTCVVSSSNHHDKYLQESKNQLFDGFGTQLNVNPESYYTIERFAPKLNVLLRYFGVFNGFWRRDKETNRKAINWIKEVKKEDFYLFVHFCDAHPTYEEFTYEQEIQNLDNSVKELVKTVILQGILNKTLIVLTVDHGAWLDDLEIDSLLSDKIVRVPLIFVNPMLPSKKISKQVRLIDILPTVLDVLGEKSYTNFSGVSLMPLIKEEIYLFPEFAVSEGTLSRPEEKSIRCKDWKYVFRKDNQDELFCLKVDPLEENNLIEKEKDKAAELKRELFKLIKENQVVQKQGYNEIIERELVKMGYLKKEAVGK